MKKDTTEKKNEEIDESLKMPAMIAGIVLMITAAMNFGLLVIFCLMVLFLK